VAVAAATAAPVAVAAATAAILHLVLVVLNRRSIQRLDALILNANQNHVIVLAQVAVAPVAVAPVAVAPVVLLTHPAAVLVACQIAAHPATVAAAAAIAAAPVKAAVLAAAAAEVETFVNTCLILGSFLISMVMEEQQDLIMKILSSLREAKTESGTQNMIW